MASSSSPKEAAKHPPNPPRIRLGNYYADIVIDRRSDPMIYHWLIQKTGSADILMWRQEYSLEAATREANAALERFAAGDRYNQAGRRWP